jgi:3-methyladenine DNA glycosylase/8-oxoguanine DNA glycosylase
MIVPSWMYWVAIAALGAAVLGQQVRVSNAQRATAQLRLEYETEMRGRAEDLAKYREEKAAIAATSG